MPALVLASFAALSIVLAVVDLRHHRLPHALVLPGLALALALLNVAAISAGALDRVEGVWGGAASAFLVCLLLHRVRPAGFGGGDVTLSALAGAHLGWFGADVVIVGLVAGFACGGAVAAGALLAGLRHAEVAFGPPLLLGTWWALLRAIT